MKKIKTLLDFKQTSTGQLNDEISKNINWEHVESTPRDLLIFDSYIPHKSDKNNSNTSRRIIFYFTYNDSCYGDLHSEYLKKKYFHLI